MVGVVDNTNFDNSVLSWLSCQANLGNAPWSKLQHLKPVDAKILLRICDKSSNLIFSGGSPCTRVTTSVFFGWLLSCQPSPVIWFESSCVNLAWNFDIMWRRGDEEEPNKITNENLETSIWAVNFIQKKELNSPKVGFKWMVACTESNKSEREQEYATSDLFTIGHWHD